MARALPLASLCAALLVAGCGGDGTEASPVASSPEPATTTAPEPTATAGKPRSDDEDPDSPTTSEPLDPEQDDPVDDDELVVEEDGASRQGSTASPAAGRKPARRKRPSAKKRRSKPPEVKVVRGDDIPQDAQVAIDAAKETIRAIIEYSNKADPKLCTDLFTLNHVENSTGKKGDAAVAQCRRDVENSKIKIKLDGIDGVRILPDTRALVTYRSSIAGISRRQTVVLVEQDDRYKLDGAA